ncbi:V-type proton ATPase subunit C [Zea mays]|uniref:V-type proton ATPase subunit C n=1 Tax=Zea mays TaxID=4577 RepID=A0A1D6G843_MAIZE|nr:V-type proton ATPase subunit C [Zea mays]
MGHRWRSSPSPQIMNLCSVSSSIAKPPWVGTWNQPDHTNQTTASSPERSLTAGALGDTLLDDVAARAVTRRRHHSSLWSHLQDSIFHHSFDTPLYRFNVPELRVDTLDSLLALSDDLVKVRRTRFPLFALLLAQALGSGSVSSCVCLYTHSPMLSCRVCRTRFEGRSRTSSTPKVSRAGPSPSTASPPTPSSTMKCKVHSP